MNKKSRRDLKHMGDYVGAMNKLEEDTLRFVIPTPELLEKYNHRNTINYFGILFLPVYPEDIEFKDAPYQIAFRP